LLKWRNKINKGEVKVKITNLEKTPMTKMDMEGAKDTYKQIPISKADGTPNFSFRVFTIMPVGHTPYPITPKIYEKYPCTFSMFVRVKASLDSQKKAVRIAEYSNGLGGIHGTL